MNKDYLQFALQTFNGGNWYGWRKVDDDGNKIPAENRMTYANVIVIKEGVTKPSESDVNTKIQELKDADADKVAKKASGKQKFKDLGLDEEELKSLLGV